VLNIWFISMVAYLFDPEWLDNGPSRKHGLAGELGCSNSEGATAWAFGLSGLFSVLHSWGPMRIYGIDFTSAPGPSKPLTCAQAEIRDRTVQIRTVQYWTDFTDFEAFLGSEGPWVAALDFPFGLPRKLVRNLRWPETWEACVTQVTRLNKAAFGHLLEDYQATRPNGDKHHLRETDVLARARSPMMWFGVPVARMFFEGVPRLLRSDVCILPCRPNRGFRVVLEGYPASLGWSSFL
jgi:hypothetical protein